MDILDITSNAELAEFGKKMGAALMRFKTAIESWWSVMESYGVTLDKLNEVGALIDNGDISRREGWLMLGLPEREFPGDPPQ